MQSLPTKTNLLGKSVTSTSDEIKLLKNLKIFLKLTKLILERTETILFWVFI